MADWKPDGYGESDKETGRVYGELFRVDKKMYFLHEKVYRLDKKIEPIYLFIQPIYLFIQSTHLLSEEIQFFLIPTLPRGRDVHVITDNVNHHNLLKYE
uniref:Uncharacterized protein n=2 Tax=unclassified Candidatus Kentrum TaxID=2643149 RepID=A0A451ASY7_9GAMM|nr:MAG: hypothetical protein BECKLPF1236B_GA0070989_12761 [Candidatus Kentron sp. LPFa]VFK69097.1 MAG: hypothetical protein BECKUNK1418H_GA0071006_101019 [Candidatus Kentron sp. UNK]VFK69271.1 MAG: hypothetical protein BECKUNK1418G_GA0071005_13361 [Candidatus Kentron sp. UNK]